MMSLPVTTITIYFFQNKTSQFFTEKNKDHNYHNTKYKITQHDYNFITFKTY